MLKRVWIVSAGIFVTIDCKRMRLDLFRQEIRDARRGRSQLTLKRVMCSPINYFKTVRETDQSHEGRVEHSDRSTAF